MKTSGTTAMGERREDQERREAHDDAEADPAQLLVRLRVPGVAKQVQQAHQDGRDVRDEIAEPETLDALQPLRETRRGLGRQQRELRRDVRRRRHVQERQQAARANGSGKQQKEVQEERRQQGPEQVLREPRRLPPVVARSGRGDHVDRERREAQGPEDPGDARALPGDGEEADDQVEEADERQEEILRVEPDRRLPEGDAADLAVRDHDQSVRERLAREHLLGARERGRRLAVRHDDPVARGEARLRRRALRLDRHDLEGSSFGSRRQASGREAVDLPSERDERDPDRGHRDQAEERDQ
jgi:hypothetical protein